MYVSMYICHEIQKLITLWNTMHACKFNGLISDKIKIKKQFTLYSYCTHDLNNLHLKF